MKHKMVIVMRSDLNMRKGKMIAQGAHAAEMPFIFPPETEQDQAALLDTMTEWITESHMLKICVRAESEAELLFVAQQAKAAGIPCYVITDDGLTEFGGVPTKTCLALGPDLSEKIDAITGSMRLL